MMDVKMKIALYFSWFVAFTTSVKGFKSCGEIKDAKENISAPYFIEIGGKNVTVSCNLTSNPAVTTILVDDVEQVPDPGSYGKPQSYVYEVEYGKLSVNDVKAFIEQSESCKQYVSYKCKNASLFGNTNVSFSSWTSVSDSPITYWADCGFPDPTCRCDQGKTTLEEDTGYLSKKKDLPVKSLQIGGLTSSSNVSVMIGNITCYGDSQVNAFTFEDKNAYVFLNVSLMKKLHFKFKLAKVVENRTIARLSFQNSAQKILQIRVNSESKLEVGWRQFFKVDEEWHSIMLSMERATVFGVIDNGVRKALFEFVATNLTTVGGMLVFGDLSGTCETFVGCVKELIVDGKDYTGNIKESKMKKFVEEGCKAVQSNVDCTALPDTTVNVRTQSSTNPSAGKENKTEDGDGNVDDDGDGNNNDAAIIAIVVVFLILLIILLVVFFITWYFKRNKGVYQTHEGSAEDLHGDTQNLTLITKPCDQEADRDKGKEYYL